MTVFVRRVAAMPGSPNAAAIGSMKPGSRALRLPAASGTLATVLLSGMVGLALVTLGIPRTMAAWYNAAAEPALQKLNMQGTPSAEELATGVAALQRSLLWDRSARRLADLSWLELVQALPLTQADPLRGELLAHSERHLVDSLVANPANGFGWLRLATVLELQGAPRRRIAAALAKSLDMAPNVRPLWIPRAAMFFVYWLDLTSDELLAMKGHLQMVWSEDETIRLPLLQAADRTGSRALVGWALIGNDQARQEFDVLASKSARDSTRQ